MSHDDCDTDEKSPPDDRLGDRPRMAEALASLNEGLRESADPLYDGWKRKPGAAAAHRSTPDVSSHEVGRAPLPRDTVRVRVIRYQVFPKWALIAAAALIVFSASVAALRFSWHPSAVSPSSPPSNPFPTPSRLSSGFASDLAVAADPAAVVAEPDPLAAEPAPLAAAAADPASTGGSETRVTAPSGLARPVVAAPAARAIRAAAPVASPPKAAPSATGKSGSSGSRRKPSSDPGFFRDPGF